MGCDIHIVLERSKKKTSKWIGVWSSDCFPSKASGRPAIAKRDYEFFSEIAGVCGYSATTIYPKNLPEDISSLAWQQYMSAPTDHHSASHMDAAEFIDAWFRVQNKRREVQGYRHEYGVAELLGVWPEEENDFQFRVVFWFDN